MGSYLGSCSGCSIDDGVRVRVLLVFVRAVGLRLYLRMPAAVWQSLIVRYLGEGGQ
jgi:hypothetical protein